MGKNAKLLKSMTPEQRAHFISANRSRGGKERAKQFTSASQRRARKHLSPEKAAANGRKGAAKTIELYGYDKLFEAARQKRLELPNKLELLMIGLLARLNVKYEREYVLQDTYYTVDFCCADYRLAIEVDGSIHDPGKPQFMKRQDYARRKEALCAQLGLRLIRVHHTELGDDLRPVIEKLQQALRA